MYELDLVLAALTLSLSGIYNSSTVCSVYFLLGSSEVSNHATPLLLRSYTQEEHEVVEFIQRLVFIVGVEVLD